MTLIGRTPLLDAIEGHLGEGRLVTLVGPSGVGKTKVAEVLASRRRGTLVTLERTPAAPPVAIAQHVAAACGQPVGDDESDSVFLQGITLLVLDGADGHATALAALVPKWLSAHPSLHVVATSRAPLDLSMEQLAPVPPLALEDARALFLDRASQVVTDFSPDDEDAFERLLHATAGLPLAIELAAGQMRVKTCTELAATLDGQEHALDGGHLDAPERHRSLTAAIDTSVHALSPSARRAFAHAGAFAGAFTVDALARVLRASIDDAQGAVEELVHASLLTAFRAHRQMRFDLLHPVRAYAASRLHQSADSAAARSAHATAFAAAYAPTVEISVHDLADLRRVKTNAAIDGDQERAARASLALALEAQGRGAAYDVEQALADLDAAALSPFLHAAVALAKARARLVFAGADTTTLLREAAAALKQRDDQENDWEALDVEHLALLALNARVSGQSDVEAAFDQALEKAEEHGHHPTTARLRSDFAAAMFERRNIEKSRSLFLDVLDDAVALGDERAEGVARTNLALVHQEAGDLDDADASMRQALALHRKVGNARFEAITLGDLGALSLERTLWLRARSDFEAAVTALQSLGDRRHEALARAGLAFTFALLDDETRCQQEFRRAERCLAKSKDDPFQVALAIYRDGIAQVAAARARFRLPSTYDKKKDEALTERIDAHAQHPHAERSDEVRLAHRLVQSMTQACRTTALAVSISGACVLAQSDDDTTLFDLSEKRALREILRALVDNRLRETDGVAKEALINAGWPGEKMSASSAKNRLHVSISGLRKAGLGDAIVASNDRYRLVPNAQLVIVR